MTAPRIIADLRHLLAEFPEGPYRQQHAQSDEGQVEWLVAVRPDHVVRLDDSKSAQIFIAAMLGSFPALLDVCEATAAQRAASQALAAYVEEHGDEDYDDPAFLSLCADEEGASLDIGAALSRLGGA